MKKMQKNNIFFDVEEILKKDCLVNMVYGARGIGKTYSSLKYAIKNYHTTGSGTIYLRRYKDELADFKDILNTIIVDNDIKDIEFSKSGKEFIDSKNKKTIIKALPLSKSVIKKSNDYSHFNLIIFDEFILDKSNYQYIPNEFIHFNNMIETISRLREITQNTIVKIIMLSNSASRINPYFIGYNIPIFEGNLYIKNDLLVYHPNMDKFVEAKKKTRWGRFLDANTDMSKYIFDGDFNDNLKFIEKLPPKTRQVANIIYLKYTMGIFITLDNSKIYISEKYNKQLKTYALTKNDATPDIQVLNKDNIVLMRIKQYWEAGNLRFETYKTKQIFMDILKIL